MLLSQGEREQDPSPLGRGRGPSRQRWEGEGEGPCKYAAALLLALTLLLPLPAAAQTTDPTPPREQPRAETPPLSPEEQRLLGDWRITGVDGHAVIPGSRPRLKLEGLRISGTTGCNTLVGIYRVERGYLTTGGVITTRRACSPALMRQEKALLALLDQRLAVQQSHRGRLLLTGRDGKTLVLVRASAQ
ncbi:META domain-containing protein [Sphingomonas sp. HT-1]|nr:META domain-containing protein [Sphingomonas sp. ATCC 31555]